jgi:hypothetical protein
VVTEQFDKVISTIARLYPEGISDTEFTRVHLFYSLFTAVYHCLHGLPKLKAERAELASSQQIQRARNGLDRVAELFNAALTGRLTTLSTIEQQFIEDSRRATTDEPVRERRTTFLVDLMR